MAKRFSDTGKWKKRWFRKLPLLMKVVFEYLRDNCDHAGVWDMDLEQMAFGIGVDEEEIVLDEILEAFGGRVRLIDGDKLYLPDFPGFQYGVLNPENRAHLSVMKRLEKLGAHPPINPEDGIPDEEGPCSFSEAPSDFQEAPYRNPQGATQRAKDKEEDKELKKGGTGENKLTPRGLADLWNQHATRLPKVQQVTKSRESHARGRLGENSDPAYWERVIRSLESNPFNRGENDRGWVATFDYLLRPDTHVKIAEKLTAKASAASKPIERQAERERKDAEADAERVDCPPELRGVLAKFKIPGVA